MLSLDVNFDAMDYQTLRTTYADFEPSQLAGIIIRGHQYEPEALRAAEDELQARGLTETEIQRAEYEWVEQQKVSRSSDGAKMDQFFGTFFSGIKSYFFPAKPKSFKALFYSFLFFLAIYLAYFTLGTLVYTGSVDSLTIGELINIFQTEIIYLIIGLFGCIYLYKQKRWAYILLLWLVANFIGYELGILHQSRTLDFLPMLGYTINEPFFNVGFESLFYQGTAFHFFVNLTMCGLLMFSLAQQNMRLLLHPAPRIWVDITFAGLAFYMITDLLPSLIFYLFVLVLN